jgi:hypothetical protein
MKAIIVWFYLIGGGPVCIEYGSVHEAMHDFFRDQKIDYLGLGLTTPHIVKESDVDYDVDLRICRERRTN